MRRAGAQGLTLVDLVVAVALLVLLVSLVRLDWRSPEPARGPTTAQHSR